MQYLILYLSIFCKFVICNSVFLAGSPGQLNVTDFDFESIQTPSVPVELLVSPLSQQKVTSFPHYTHTTLGPDDFTKYLPPAPTRPSVLRSGALGGGERVHLSSQVHILLLHLLLLLKYPTLILPLLLSDYSNMSGVRQLLRTPGRGLKEPMNDLTNVEGVRQLLATPR